VYWKRFNEEIPDDLTIEQLRAREGIRVRQAYAAASEKKPGLKWQALGFVHRGKMMSFVYDIADLYKTEVTVPAAFATVRENEGQIETRVRKTCRDLFFETPLLECIVPDIFEVFGASATAVDLEPDVLDRDEAIPGGLWDPVLGRTEGE
jgi:CRISPR-associated protein Cas1